MRKDRPNIGDLFAEAERAFARADKLFETVDSAPLNPDYTYINFKGKRWATFRKFFGCALEALFFGETILVIKKK